MIDNFSNEENNEEEYSLTKAYDVEACLEENFYKYKIIIQLFIICLSCIILIITYFTKVKSQISSILKLPEISELPELSKPSDLYRFSEPSKVFEPSKPFEPQQGSINTIPGKEPLVNMYISTHKDFKNNVITNPVYKILCDRKSQLKNNYNLEIIETNINNELYPKNRGYSEGSKIYPIWKLYKEGNITSKYVGLFHYRRVFPFKNDVPDLDEIFLKYDVIVKERYTHKMTTYQQFDLYHYVSFLDECVDIIKEKYPEYYEDSRKFLNKTWANYCNIFIAKKEDFIKWGDFVFGVLLELDKKYNLKTDDVIKNLIIKKAGKRVKNSYDYQARLEAFLMERVGNMFYEHHWKKRYEIPTVDI